MLVASPSGIKGQFFARYFSLQPATLLVDVDFGKTKSFGTFRKREQIGD